MEALLHNANTHLVFSGGIIVFRNNHSDLHPSHTVSGHSTHKVVLSNREARHMDLSCGAGGSFPLLLHLTVVIIFQFIHSYVDINLFAYP